MRIPPMCFRNLFHCSSLLLAIFIPSFVIVSIFAFTLGVFIIFFFSTSISILMLLIYSGFA